MIKDAMQKQILLKCIIIGRLRKSTTCKVKFFMANS